jgi:hypothetical protein
MILPAVRTARDAPYVRDQPKVIGFDARGKIPIRHGASQHQHSQHSHGWPLERHPPKKPTDAKAFCSTFRPGTATPTRTHQLEVWCDRETRPWMSQTRNELELHALPGGSRPRNPRHPREAGPPLTSARLHPLAHSTPCRWANAKGRRDQSQRPSTDELPGTPVPHIEIGSQIQRVCSR